MQIGEIVRRAAIEFGDAPALVEGDRVMSFRAFDAATDRLGNALLATGLVPGDRVAQLANDVGFEQVLVAENATDEAMLSALIQWKQPTNKN